MKASRLASLIATASLVFCSFNAAFGQLSSGLLNYWNFEGNYNDTAGTVPGAASTFADTGTTPAGGVTITPSGLLGQYGNFAGLGNYVEVPNSADVLAGGESLTLSVWFRVTAFDRSWQALIAHGETNDYRIARSGTNSFMAYAGGTGDIQGGPAVNDGQWHHVVAITEAAVSTRLWIDGVLIATGGVANLVDNGTPQLMIGGNPNDAGAAYRSWNGDIDDVGMWSRPLTPGEIGTIYSAGLLGTPLGGLFDTGDTDGDGLPNLWETIYGLNPNSPAGNDGASGDPDLDGLSNLLEFNPHQTNPKVADTDGDGLSDGAEVNTHHTNPTVADTDRDGLSDGAEVNTHHTNPLAPDTDGDGVTDASELAKGTNPVVADTGLSFGLVGYWPMDADFNSTIGGMTATANGSTAIPRVAGKFGNAAQFDGIDQFLVVDGDPNQLNFAGQNMTVSAWFTADQVSRSWQALMGKGDSSNNWRVHTRGEDVPPELSFCGGSADIPKHSVPLNVGTGFYHHVVGVSELGVSVRLYIDGALVSTGPAPTLLATGTPLRIGDNAGATGRYWNGKIDDVAFWCRPLSTAEIGLLYNSGTGASVGDLLGPQVVFQFTQTNYNKLTNQWTLSWTSKPGRTYSLNYSTNMTDFSSDVDDSIPTGGDSTTFGPFLNPVPASGPRIYFRVREN